MVQTGVMEMKQFVTWGNCKYGGMNSKLVGSRVDEMNGLAMVSSDIGKSCSCTRNCPRYFKHNETT